jgi:FAD/FMN-containing dehydrogenase
MNVTLTSSAQQAIEELRTSLTGRLVEPADPGFDTLRGLVYGGFEDVRPAAIARVADAADVSRVVQVAARTGVELAVRGGGHSIAGHSTTDGGLVLDLRDLTTLDIDPTARTAWASTGLTAGQVTSAAAEHGLAVGFGDTGSVGIGGITLGGGVGYLVRKHGLTIDSLRAAEVVLADGSIVIASPDEHPDLFWAIRGGGGNFGVVTRFLYRLHPLEQFTGGLLVLPATADTVAGWIAASDEAPEELSTIANVMPGMPMPGIPEQVFGKLVLIGMVAFAGDDAAAQAAIAPFRALAEPLADLVKPMPYPELYAGEEGEAAEAAEAAAEGGEAAGPAPEEYHPTAVARTMFVDPIGVDEAETVMSFLESSDAPIRVAQLRVLGGAASRVPADATAYAHRASRIMVHLAAFYDGPEDRVLRERWVDEFAAALQQDDRGVYVNFLADEGAERVRAAYPGGTWDRLVEIKRRYDPENVFRRNQNVAPA